MPPLSIRNKKKKAFFLCFLLSKSYLCIDFEENDENCKRCAVGDYRPAGHNGGAVADANGAAVHG